MKAEQKVLESGFGVQTTGQLGRVWRPIIIACLVAASAAGQNAREAHGAAAVVPLQNELPAKIVVDPPLPQALSFGAVVVQYRTENLRVVPVFGPAALSLSPRVGHVHVSVDDAPWVWAHASREPVIVAGMAPGQHNIRVQLMTANHQRLDEGAVKFTVPEAQIPAAAATHIPRQVHGAALRPLPAQPAAKIIIDSPLPEPLSRGVVFIRYRTENLDIVPVFGSAALAVSPRIGHIHVTVDEAPWHWADASRNPVIVQGLVPGRHKILIELVNASDEVTDQRAVEIAIPAPNSQPAAHTTHETKENSNAKIRQVQRGDPQPVARTVSRNAAKRHGSPR